MSSAFHTPISINAPADAATFNTPDGQLDQALYNSLHGDELFVQQRFQVGAGTLVISGSAITITNSYHTIDTSGGAANLQTINGGQQGDVLRLVIANAANPVTFKHNTGNIYFSGAADLVINDTQKMLFLFYNGTKWVDDYKLAATPILHLQDAINPVSAAFDTLAVPRGVTQTSGIGVAANRPFMNVVPGSRGRKTMWVNCQAAFEDGVGQPAPVVVANAKVDNSFAGFGIVNQYQTTNVANNAAHLQGDQGHGGGAAAAGVFQLRYNLYMHFSLWLNVYSNMSIYAGFNDTTLWSADPGGIAQRIVGLMASTTSGFANWQGVTIDGTAGVGHHTEVDTGVVAATGKADLEMWYDNVGSKMWFSVNGSTPVGTTATIPNVNSGMRWQLALVTRAAANKTVNVSRIYLECD